MINTDRSVCIDHTGFPVEFFCHRQALMSIGDAFVRIYGVVGKAEVDQDLGLLGIGFGGLEIQQERVNARLSSFLREGRLSNHAEDASQE